MRTTHTPSAIFNVNDVKFSNIRTVPCKSKISILVKEMIQLHSAGTVKNTCFLGFVAKLAIIPGGGGLLPYGLYRYVPL